MEPTKKKHRFFATRTKHLFREVMREAGIVDSRIEENFDAIYALHKAFCNMEPWQQQRFFSIFKFGREVREGLFKLLEVFGASEDLRWEFEQDWEKSK